MQPIMIAGLFVLAGAVGIGVLVWRSRQADIIAERLSQYTERQMSLEELELQQPFMQRIVAPAANRIFTKFGKLAPSQQNEKMKTNLMLAGNPHGLTPTTFTGLKLVAGLVLFAVGFLLTMLAGMELQKKLMYSFGGIVLGYLLPGMWLGQQIKKRKKAILKALPDALDLLTISVEAGLGFDLALQRVASKWDNELCVEFRRLLGDMQLGVPSRDAMRSMVVRAGVDDVATFVAAVIQAQQLGVSMAKILKVQSDQLRLRRRQRAEEQAQKAPVKMLFPMVFLIFPSIFVVILGPAVPRIMGSL